MTGVRHGPRERVRVVLELIYPYDDDAERFFRQAADRRL
jgi:hypothetical protein